MTDSLSSSPPRPDPATTGLETSETNVGSVFVSNYPPYSAWGTEGVSAVDRVLAEPPRPDTPLGLYLHIPFCRKRCKFCYFRVYTDKNFDEIGSYVEALANEVESLAKHPAIANRPLKFVYFGGWNPLLPLGETPQDPEPNGSRLRYPGMESKRSPSNASPAP